MKPFEQMEHLSHVQGQVCFESMLRRPLVAENIDILQLNVGRRCNLTCKHCHVMAGPHRPELMDRHVFEKCLQVLTEYPISTIDITGGAPEMNPLLPWFVREASKLGRRMLIRSNLLILLEERYRFFTDLYTEHQVEIVTSLPDVKAQRMDRQRGKGAFAGFIRMMQELNAKGYGQAGSGLVLDLVYNPVGAYLPGSQSALEHEYKKQLLKEYGITFNHLFCLTNCPVGRYLDYLIRSENYEDYMNELINAFNRSALNNVMCRSTLSVGWNGKLYDCDFNQMLDLTVNHGAPMHIDRFDFKKLKNRRIVTANHCYACTAGAGSSCQGALNEANEEKCDGRCEDMKQ
jgi:radical SAM/Cys-rich protein